jgi:hypothetical protein
MGTILDVGPPFLIAIDKAHLLEHFHNYNSYPETNSFRDIRFFSIGKGMVLDVGSPFFDCIR